MACTQWSFSQVSKVSREFRHAMLAGGGREAGRGSRTVQLLERLKFKCSLNEWGQPHGMRGGTRRSARVSGGTARLASTRKKRARSDALHRCTLIQNGHTFN